MNKGTGNENTEKNQEMIFPYYDKYNVSIA